ncbi:barstar family protein [Paenarthrobacter ureafaciens]
MRNHQYKVVKVDAAAWQSQADLHQDVALALDFPDYYGSNLDALNDCLGDVAGTV